MIEHRGKTLFTYDELHCPRTGTVQLARGFSSELKELRLAFELPMIVNSCCRSKEYNTDIGGHHRSLHVWDYPYWPTGGTCAIDISIRNMSEAVKKELVGLAFYLGWSVGIAETFLHLDRRSDYIPKNNPKSNKIKFYYA